MSLIRVLIIDDSVTIRAVLEQLIANDRECEVGGIVSDVAAARERVGSGAIDVITLDLAMPGIDGLHFLDELANRHHAPVVVVSSSTKEGTAAYDEALARGADACFDKARIMSDTANFMRVLKKTARNRKRGHAPIAKAGATTDTGEDSPVALESADPATDALPDPSADPLPAGNDARPD